jgi:phospholipase/carboxylesterase
MKTVETSLFHRVLPPKGSPKASRHPTVIFLHGRGADEEDLLSVAPLLDSRLLLLSVRAPYPFSGGGYTWYDLQQIGSPDLAMFRASYDRLSAFLDDAADGYPVDPEYVFLFGFSMGTVLSYALSLSRPDRIRAVAANSGYLPEIPDLNYRWQDMAGTSFFITHGIHDPVIPVSMARHARDLMAATRAPVTYREYDMSHTLGEQALADVAAWISGFLD